MPSGLPRERTGAMGDDPDRKSGWVPCRKGGVDHLHRNGQTPTPRLPGKWLGERTRWWVFLLTAAKGSLCCNARFGPNSSLGDCWLHGWGNGYTPSGQATDDEGYISLYTHQNTCAKLYMNTSKHVYTSTMIQPVDQLSERLILRFNQSFSYEQA